LGLNAQYRKLVKQKARRDQLQPAAATPSMKPNRTGQWVSNAVCMASSGHGIDSPRSLTLRQKSLSGRRAILRQPAASNLQ
jgi:hypothetical protein